MGGHELPNRFPEGRTAVAIRGARTVAGGPDAPDQIREPTRKEDGMNDIITFAAALVLLAVAARALRQCGAALGIPVAPVVLAARIAVR
jgi:hypothetical protein